MAVRIIRKDTDPVLRKKAKDIQEITPAILRLLEDMAETMDAANGVGLAAPQVGIAKRIVLVKIGKNELLELINPVILKQKGDEVDVEGCLSFPGLYGEVARATEVEVEALDRQGKKKIIKGTGLLARALQHEIDHLEGVLFVDKVLKFTEK
jgi:peptide deformylase